MPVAAIILAAAYFDRETLAIGVGFLLLCKLVAHLRSTTLELHYSKTNPLFKEFVQKTAISTMTYETYIFAPRSVL